MHEFSLSKEIVSEIKKIANEEEADLVDKVELLIGKLSHLNVEQLNFCFDTIVKDEELFEDCSLVIEENEVEINCECGYNGTVGEETKKLSSLAKHLKCPKCGNLNPSIEKGKEVLIKSVEIKRE